MRFRTNPLRLTMNFVGSESCRCRVFYLSPFWNSGQVLFSLFSRQYSGDSDDKQWLYEQNELPITGGKV